MNRIGEILAIVLNVVFVFATVSYVATSVSDQISSLLNWRAKLLVSSIKSLLDDPHFTGLARDLYRNPLLYGLGSGEKIQTEADLDQATLPSNIDKLIFGQALIEALEIEDAARPKFVPAATAPAAPTPVGGAPGAPAPAAAAPVGAAPGAGAPANPATSANSLLNFEINAKANLDKVLPPDSRLNEMATTMLLRNCRDPKVTSIETALINMVTEIGNWFEFSQTIPTYQFSMRMKLVNVLVGFVLAALLDLEPLPIGEGSLAAKIPYAVKVFQWLLIGSSTYFGGSFWFQFVKFLASAGVAAPPPPTGGPAGQVQRS